MYQPRFLKYYTETHYKWFLHNFQEACDTWGKMKKTIVLYHAHCPDGFTAAWAAWKKFKNEADYIAVKYQVPPPSGLKDKNVYLLDFAYDRKTTEKLIKENKSVVIVDHHITTKKELFPLFNNRAIAPLNNQFIFNNDRSGAHLAWKHFHPGKPILKIILLVEDFDLWKFKLPLVREVSAFLEAHNFEFKIWNKIAALLDDPKTLRECAEKGKLILAYQKKITKDITSSASEVQFAGHKALAANCPILRSEIGHELVRKKPPLSIVWREKGGQLHVSLRGNGKIDCAKIAEEYGGGGHKNAAGFILKKGQKIPWN